MKKNILMLINGFGVEKAGTYSVYSPELLPNIDRFTKEKIFTTIPNKFLDYRNAYRNFSMGIDDALTYNLIENNIYKNEYEENQMLKYIIQQVNKDEKTKLHFICYWDGERTAGQIATYVREIKSKVGINNKILIHLILCQKSIEDYSYIARNLTTLNYELGVNVKLGFITGEENINSMLPLKEVIKTLVTEYGEKYKDLNKKVEVQTQTKIPPCKTRTFAVSYGYGIQDNDIVMFFNYSNVDVNNFRKELREQKYRKFDEGTIQYFSLFPVKSETKIPFVYNYAVASSYFLNSLKSINAKCVIFEEKDKCPYINYYLTGLRNDVDESLKYMPTDDGFIYNKDLLIQNLTAQKDKDLIIINYDISSVKTIEELKDKLHSIDEMLGVVDAYCVQNSIALFVSSLYGFARDMYNVKKELLSISYYGKVPVMISDKTISLADYTIDTGNLHDLCDTILRNINPEYPETGLFKKKSTLFSFLYKKPKKG